MESMSAPVLRSERKAAVAPRALRMLVVGEAVSLAHVGRPAVLARWAQSAGHRVTFACGPRLRELAEGEGLVPRPVFTIDGQAFYARLRAGRFFYTRADLEEYLRADRAFIRDVRPDLVVGDFRLTLPMACKLEGVPFLALSHAHWSPASPRPMPAPQTGFFRHLPPSVGAALFAAARPLAYRFFAKVLDDLRAAHGLERLHDFRRHYTDGEGCAYLDLPELAPLRSLPPGHFYLGPLAWQPRITGAVAPLPKEATGKRLVYVSFGSSGDMRVLPDVLRGVRLAGCAAVVSGLRPEAARQMVLEVPELSGSCVFVPRVHPDEVLRRAQLTVCHGGAGTVYQSLAAGVPVLCIPDNPDQMMIASSITEHGAGSSLRSRGVSATQVRREIERLIACVLVARRVGLLGMSIRCHDTRARWLQGLEQFAPATST